MKGMIEAQIGMKKVKLFSNFFIFLSHIMCMYVERSEVIIDYLPQ